MEEVVDLTADNSAHIVHQEGTQTRNSAVDSTPLENNEKIASDSSTQDDWLKGCLKSILSRGYDSNNNKFLLVLRIPLYDF